MTVKRKPYVPSQAVLEELDRYLKTGIRPDYITFSGSGEPTLNSDLGCLIAAVKRRTRIPVAVLTNASLLWKPAVRDALAAADVVLPSLSAGNSRIFHLVNRPHSDLKYGLMLEGLLKFAHQFKGKIWFEVFLLKGITSMEKEVERLAKVARKINPSRIQLNTVIRPPSDPLAKPVSTEKMRHLAFQFGRNAEILPDFHASRGSKSRTGEATGIKALLGRRPCTLSDIAQGLHISHSEALKILGKLIEQKSVVSKRQNGQAFFTTIGAQGENR